MAITRGTDGNRQYIIPIDSGGQTRFITRGGSGGRCVKAKKAGGITEPKEASGMQGAVFMLTPLNFQSIPFSWSGELAAYQNALGAGKDQFAADALERAWQKSAAKFCDPSEE